MANRLTLYVTAGAITAGLMFGCAEKTPSRDHIPVLRQAVYRLQEAVKAKDRAAIDSLLSPKILRVKQSSDSLVRFVYGPEDDFAFERFGNCEIVYTGELARVDCFVIDSAGARDRPVVFTFAHEHDLWLLRRFDKGIPSVDTLDTVAQ